MKHLQAKPDAVIQATQQSLQAEPSESSVLVDERRRAVTVENIGVEHAGQRLDHFLVRICKTVPKSHIYRILRSGEVRVNGKRCSGDQRLVEGDKVRVPPIRILANVRGTTQNPSQGTSVHAQEFPVLFEDDFLLIINKPEGTAVHGGSGISSGVVERLRAARPELRYLELVHRIDKETSGLLMLAKRRSALVHLQDQFRLRTIVKHYRAVVCGAVPKRTRTFDGNLLVQVLPNGQKQVSVRADGVSAITRVTGIEQWPLSVNGANGNNGSKISQVASLIDAKIETGRTHQIRVHLAHHGWPIIGDQKYGNFELNKLLSKTRPKRMFLHAFSVNFYHPEVTNKAAKRLQIEAPLPESFGYFS